MLKTQITGAKYLSPQTNQMTNLNIAVPADSKDTEFGTSDILLAKDTAALVDTVKTSIIEGEKTTILAPTQVSSDFNFNRGWIPNKGELHIKVYFDKFDLRNDNFKIIEISGVSVIIKQDQYNNIIATVDGSEYIIDSCFELVLSKTGILMIKTYLTEVIANLPIEGVYVQISNTPPDGVLYTYEVFSIDYPVIKTSRLYNDGGYTTGRNGITYTKGLKLVYSSDGYYMGETYDIIAQYVQTPGSDFINIPILRFDGNSLLLKGGIKICKKYDMPDEINYDDYVDLLSIISEYEKPVYKIVDKLPTINISSKNIYMIKKTNPIDTNAKYDKYIYIAEDSAWEKIG